VFIGNPHLWARTTRIVPPPPLGLGKLIRINKA
jgi:hypothetical protein